MTDLQRIEIAGFKGIEHLEFEPSGVNLVTGRNNTGKTSLLEAVALAFDPTYVEEFGEDIDSLIHEGGEFDECRITVETVEEKLETKIRQPTVEEAGRIVTSAIVAHMKRSISRYVGQDESDRSKYLEKEGGELTKNLQNTIFQVTRGVVSEFLNSDSAERITSECHLFIYSGEEYAYLNQGDVVKGLLTKSAKNLWDEMEIHEPTDQKELVIPLQVQPAAPFAPNIGFVDEPPIRDAVTFIKSKNLLSAPDFDPESDDAIKRDDLGDYLKETGLAEELKTFNLDTLVFEKEDGEKYAVPYDFMGDGFKTVVGLLWELMDDEIEDQIVLLEEPENHMHPGYVLNVVHFLIELAREEDVQLFVTTHNKDFIDAFFNENRAGEQEAFLEEEFTLLQLQSDSAVVEDYETAREDLEELHLDLRGI